MSSDLLNSLLTNVSFGALFVFLFWWTLRSNEQREARYLTLLDCYGKQLETIANTLRVIQEQIADFLKERRVSSRDKT